MGDPVQIRIMIIEKKGIIILVLLLLLSGLTGCRTGRTRDGERAEPVKEGPVRNREPDRDQEFPRLVVKDGTDRDLGRIREGIKTSVIFTIFNEGPADASNISIHDLSQGGCTAVSQVSRLAAGDSARLEFIFETLGYGGRKETRQIKVRYGNPGLSPITLSVTAEIVPTGDHQVPIGELYYNFFVLVDIRDEIAFREGHIAGAIHIPPGQVRSWVTALPGDFMIYLCSEDGTESDALARELQDHGYRETFSIIGGIEEWKRRYGERVIIEGIH